MCATRGTVLAIILTAGATGCHGLPGRKAPTPCVTVERQDGCDGPAPQARVETKPCGDLVVHVPPPKVTLEAPPCPPPAQPQAAPPTQPQPTAQALAGVPMMTQGVMPGFFPQAMGGGIPLGMPGGMANAEVRERTGLGFVLDTARIPIPILRPVAVPRPARVTFS